MKDDFKNLSKGVDWNKIVFYSVVVDILVVYCILIVYWYFVEKSVYK